MKKSTTLALHETDNKLHSDIGSAIEAAKKRMFKNHRKGVPLKAAIEQFCKDIPRALSPYAITPDTDDDFVTVTLPNGNEVDLYGDAVDLAKDVTATEAALAEHILAIMNHPKVPNALYNAVGNFITDSTNIKDAQGESLLDRWCYEPETVAALCAMAKEEDDNKEMAEELEARIERGPR